MRIAFLALTLAASFISPAGAQNKPWEEYAARSGAEDAAEAAARAAADQAAQDGLAEPVDPFDEHTRPSAANYLEQGTKAFDRAFNNGLGEALRIRAALDVCGLQALGSTLGASIGMKMARASLAQSPTASAADRQTIHYVMSSRAADFQVAYQNGLNDSLSMLAQQMPTIADSFKRRLCEKATLAANKQLSAIGG